STKIFYVDGDPPVNHQDRRSKGDESMSKIAALKSAIDTEFADILGRDFPAFSEAEMARRVKLAEELIARRAVDGLIVAEALRAGTATGWFTGWPVTAEAVTLIAPGLPRRLHVQHYNHLPLAR